MNVKDLPFDALKIMRDFLEKKYEDMPLILINSPECEELVSSLNAVEDAMRLKIFNGVEPLN